MSSRQRLCSLAIAGTLAIGLGGIVPTWSASAAKPPLGPQDRHFLYWAAESSKADAAMERLALRQATDAGIKSFARNALAADKGRMASLAALAGAQRVKLPQDLDKESRSVHDDLAAVTGDGFDNAFIRNAVAEILKTINLYEEEASSGKNPAIEAFVADALPELQKIYDAARHAELGLRGSAPLMSPSGTIETHKPSPSPMPG